MTDTTQTPTSPTAPRPAAPQAPSPYLDPAADRFHEIAIRAAKGIVKAWEEWYHARRAPR